MSEELKPLDTAERIVFLEKVVNKADKRVEKRDARIAELEKAFSLLIAVTVNGRIIKGRVGDYYQPQVPVAEIDNARKALKESGE